MEKREERKVLVVAVIIGVTIISIAWLHQNGPLIHHPKTPLKPAHAAKTTIRAVVIPKAEPEVRIEETPRKYCEQWEVEATDAAEKFIETAMNNAGYKTHCLTFLNEEGTFDIEMVSRSFKDSSSTRAIDNYIGAAVATVGKCTSNAKWESRKLTIKVGLGKRYEISTSDCRKVVKLFNQQLYQEASDYLFAHLKIVNK